MKKDLKARRFNVAMTQKTYDALRAMSLEEDVPIGHLIRNSIKMFLESIGK